MNSECRGRPCPVCFTESFAHQKCPGADLICMNDHVWHHHKLPTGQGVDVVGGRLGPPKPSIACAYCEAEKILTNRHLCFKLVMMYTQMKRELIGTLCPAEEHKEQHLKLYMDGVTDTDMTCGKGHYWHGHRLRKGYCWFNIPSNETQQKLREAYQDWAPCACCKAQGK